MKILIKAVQRGLRFLGRREKCRSETVPDRTSSQEQATASLGMKDDIKEETLQLLEVLFPPDFPERKWHIGNKNRPTAVLEIERSKTVGEICTVGIVDYSDQDESGLPLEHVFVIETDGNIPWANFFRSVRIINDNNTASLNFPDCDDLGEDSAPAMNAILRKFVEFGHEISANTKTPIVFHYRK